MKKIKCRLIGHEVSDDYTDSGNWICKYCKSHSYYDFDKDFWDKTPLLLIPKEIFIRIKMKVNNYLTKDELPF